MEKATPRHHCRCRCDSGCIGARWRSRLPFGEWRVAVTRPFALLGAGTAGRLRLRLARNWPLVQHGSGALCRGETALSMDSSSGHPTSRRDTQQLLLQRALPAAAGDCLQGGRYLRPDHLRRKKSPRRPSDGDASGRRAMRSTSRRISALPERRANKSWNFAFSCT